MFLNDMNKRQTLLLPRYLKTMDWKQITSLIYVPATPCCYAQQNMDRIKAILLSIGNQSMTGYTEMILST